MAEEIQNEQRFSSPEDEILHLEQRLAEKKKELIDQREVSPSEEKEVLREVLREHVEELRSDAPTDGVAPLLPVVDVPSTSTKEQDNQVAALIEVALTKSVEEAIKRARSESPYLLDELHDHLVDDYYDRLIQLRKLKHL